MDAFIGRQVSPRAHIRDTRHAQRRRVLHGLDERRVTLRLCGPRYVRRNQRHGFVLEDAGQPTRHIPNYFTARRRGDARRHPSNLEGSSVGQCHVPVETRDEHRIVRCDLVNPGPIRKLSAPHFVVPVATEDPFALLQALGVFGQPTGELLRAVGVPKVHGGQTKPPVQEMGVSVYEARHREAAIEFDHPGVPTDHSPDHVLRADGHDRPVHHRNPRSPRITRITRPHLSANENQVSRGFPTSAREHHHHDSSQPPRPSGQRHEPLIHDSSWPGRVTPAGVRRARP